MNLRSLSFILVLAVAAAAETPSLRTVIDSVSANLDLIRTLRAQSRVIQWFG